MRISICVFLNISLAIILFAPGNAIAVTYSPHEMFIVNWGEQNNQLKICQPSYEDVEGTPSDSADDLVFPCGGPTYCFVDGHENVYFTSYEFGQFKIFDNTGLLLSDISRDSPFYNNELFVSSAPSFVVDTLLNIYFISFPELDYVPVADIQGNLLKRLYPCGETLHVKIGNIHWNSQDAICFSCSEHGYRTYKMDEFIPNGSSGWLAIDGYYYYARGLEGDIIELKKYSNPDKNGIASWRDSREISIGFEYSDVDFLGVADNMELYVYIIDLQGTGHIFIFDISYDIAGEIVFPDAPNRFDHKLSPFMRTDGNIYEFRCLDDGIHVIRWEEQ